MERAQTLVGMLVKIRDKAGKIHRGVLLDVNQASLTVERHMPIGTFSYDVNKADIESIKIIPY